MISLVSRLPTPGPVPFLPLGSPSRLRAVEIGALLFALLFASTSSLSGQEPPPGIQDTASRVLEPIRAQVARPVVLGSASALVLDLDSVEARPALDLSAPLPTTTRRRSVDDVQQILRYHAIDDRQRRSGLS